VVVRISVVWVPYSKCPAPLLVILLTYTLSPSTSKPPACNIRNLPITEHRSTGTCAVYKRQHQTTRTGLTVVANFSKNQRTVSNQLLVSTEAVALSRRIGSRQTSHNHNKHGDDTTSSINIRHKTSIPR